MQEKKFKKEKKLLAKEVFWHSYLIIRGYTGWSKKLYFKTVT